jgi:hypothetical protein
MVELENFKKKVENIISQDYQVEFLGGNFDKIIQMLSDTKAEKIYNWIEGVVKKNIRPIVIATKKHYKDWLVNQLLTFRYPLNVNDVEYRILLVKVKNSVYIEFHLGDHNYYDKIRKDLNLKKGGY